MTSEVRFYKLIKKNESSHFKAYAKSGGSAVPILFIFFHILQFPMKFASKCSFNKPKLHFLDGGLQLVVLV